MRIRLISIMTFLLFAFTAFAADDSRDAVPRFDIKSYQVEGNTLISADNLESILSSFRLLPEGAEILAPCRKP